jgi:hypothetical protein
MKHSDSECLLSVQSLDFPNWNRSLYAVEMSQWQTTGRNCKSKNSQSHSLENIVGEMDLEDF